MAAVLMPRAAVSGPAGTIGGALAAAKACQ